MRGVAPLSHATDVAMTGLYCHDGSVATSPKAGRVMVRVQLGALDPAQSILET